MAGFVLARPGHPRRPWRAARGVLANRPIVRQAVTFGAIGIVSTLAYVALYAALRPFLDAAPANALALLVTAVGNTAANRRLTFARSGRDGLVRDQAAGIGALLIALAITTSAVGILGMVAPHAGRAAELVVLVAANAFATTCRFLLLRSWIATAPRRPDRDRTAS
jgi:putative flippase GtrA